MNDHITSRFEQPGGPVHAGFGNLYYNVTVGPSGETKNRARTRRFADDDFRLLKQRFVDPGGMGEARSLLADHSTVLLHGSPGSGRTAAAKVLLYEYHRDTGIFRELLPEDTAEVDLTDPGLVGTGDRVLLDFAEVPGSQWKKYRKDLPALRNAVQDQQAHLVVVVPYEGLLEADLQFYRAEIERPPAEEVFRRHLRLHRIPHEEYLQPAPALVEFLAAQRSMGAVADLADRVRRARSAQPSDGFAAWCEKALAARKNWRTEVAGLVADQCAAPQRALLFSTAMLHGAHADVIHHATALLLRLAGTPEGEGPPLERKDLAQRLGEIRASAGPDGHVRFDSLDFDIAVRAHFWDHMPDLRKLLSAWTLESTELDDPHLDGDLRQALVQRLAEEYLRTGQGEELFALAGEWGSSATNLVRLEAAVHALTHGLENERYEASFRQLVYRWCRDKQLTGMLAYVLLRVCTDVIAPAHPDQAMTRLRYLARRERGSTLALDALCDLVATSSRLRRRLLDRLTWHSSAPDADARIFLRICDPVPLADVGDAPRALVDEENVQSCVVLGWRAVFDSLPRSHWHPYAKHWLHTAATVGDRHGLLLDLLVESASRNGKHLAALYSVARAAEPTTPGGRARGIATTDLLLQKISEAQGLGRPASSRGNTP
ncbi:hypothetical protein [Streptomyces sp. NPDC053560]|uniref:hypothetical protein n=1 Tax=Streptomyces sp. NPDC053560 TaxID=3365711 RepID=UPI0037D42333